MEHPFEQDPERGTDAAERLKQMADRVARMILTSSFSDLECALAERELRMECLRLLPESPSRRPSLEPVGRGEVVDGSSRVGAAIAAAYRSLN